MGKRKYYMVLDTETATLPFANEISRGDSNLKKKIAIARPLIYDFGYVITDRSGEIYERKQFLITEIFSVPSIFNTAYYAGKRPIYLERLQKGETILKSWNEVMNIFVEDLKKVEGIGCFNSMFDLCKAVPFTELYIKHLYSPDYYQWEEQQYHLCEAIISQPYKKKEKDFDPEHFTFRGEIYDCFDIWGMACERLINTDTYRDKCLEYGMLTASGDYFNSSAESTYRHLCKTYNFEEKHCAIDDAEIEAFILSKCLRRQGIKYGIDYFPFQQLGHPNEYVEKIRKKERQVKAAEIVYNAIYNYLGDEEEENWSNYKKGMKKKMERMGELFQQ